MDHLTPLTFEAQADRSRSVASQVYGWVRNAIVQLQFQPGSPLSEAEIARQAGISRQPVREAFLKLADGGLVDIRPQRGTFVRLISVREVETARFVREAIEIAIVRAAVEKASGPCVADLEAAIIEQRRFAEAGDHFGFLRADEDFHQAIARHAECEDAWRILEGLKVQMDRVRFMSLENATPLHTIIEQHERIMEAMRMNDAGSAQGAMRTHLTEILRSLPQVRAEHAQFFTD